MLLRTFIVFLRGRIKGTASTVFVIQKTFSRHTEHLCSYSTVFRTQSTNGCQTAQRRERRVPEVYLRARRQASTAL